MLGLSYYFLLKKFISKIEISSSFLFISNLREGEISSFIFFVRVIFYLYVTASPFYLIMSIEEKKKKEDGLF